jgi:anti-sigma regulatory factor (Ser/Thr protein kinase)
MVERGPADPADEAAMDRTDLLARDFDIRTLVALRHEVERHAQRDGLSGVALYRFVVAVNEITTNAVQHGRGGGRLELWRAGDRLYCRVTDRGPGIPPRYRRIAGPPSPHALSGRGLWLAQQGSRSLTIRSDAEGTSVTLAG